MNNIPYTYLIGWTKLNVWYYGVRYAKGCHPEDLWISYFTSSEYVKEFRDQYGDPDIIQIRKTFVNIEKAKLWEEKVLKKMNVINDKKWLNKNDKHAPPSLWGHTHNRGREKTPETIEKMRNSMINTMAEKFPIENRKKPKTNSFEEYVELHRNNTKQLWSNRSEKELKEISEKISNGLLGKPKTGKAAKGHKKDKDHVKKISESNKKVWENLSEEEKLKRAKKISESSKGRKHTEEWKIEQAKKVKEIWAKRKAGIMPMPNYDK